MKPPADERPRWLDAPAHVTLIYCALIALCLLFVALPFVVEHEVHFWEAHFWWEASLGFYPVYGFISCVSLVIIARALRRFLKRPEDYYDR